MTMLRGWVKEKSCTLIHTRTIVLEMSSMM
jgi:hypothetical protein